MPTLDPTKIVDDVIEGIDDNVYSREEAEANITSRHLADMTSDSWLSKTIRPIITIWAMAINSVLWMWSFIAGKVLDPNIAITAGAVLTAAVGFYFSSKWAERVAAKKSAAAIQISKMKGLLEVKEAKQELKIAKKEARRARRNNKGEI